MYGTEYKLCEKRWDGKKGRKNRETVTFTWKFPPRRFSQSLYYAITAKRAPLPLSEFYPLRSKTFFFVFPKALFYGTVAGGEIARNEIGLT